MLTFDTFAALWCALAIAFTGYTLAVILANWWADQWYDADGSAHHCESCGSPWLEEQATAEVAGHVSESRTVCAHCGDDCGYWADGSHSPAYRQDCIDSAMCWLRYAGPLLAVGVALWLI